MIIITAPLTSKYTMHVVEKDAKEVLVCTVGKPVLLCDMRSIAKAFHVPINKIFSYVQENTDQ